MVIYPLSQSSFNYAVYLRHQKQLSYCSTEFLATQFILLQLQRHESYTVRGSALTHSKLAQVSLLFTAVGDDDGISYIRESETETKKNVTSFCILSGFAKANLLFPFAIPMIQRGRKVLLTRNLGELFLWDMS